MIDVAIPRWTIPSFERNAGRYPLGLEAVALGQLATDLASGLPVLSRHPRYWSLYTWIIHRFSQSDHPKTLRALGPYLKQREAVFACAAFLHHKDDAEELPNVVGRNTFVPRLRQQEGSEFAIPTDYLQQSLGGYGQIYRGAMEELGLVLLAQNNPSVRCDVPFGEVGVAVAEVFEAAIADTTYAQRYATDPHPEMLPIDVLKELGAASCFCRLVDHAPERSLLTDLLLGKAQTGSNSHRNRAATIRMFLDLARATDGHPLNESQFRHLLYFGFDGAETSWNPRSDVRAIYQRWQLVQAREWVVQALNALFVDFTRWGIARRGLLQPVSLSEYAERLDRMQLPEGLDLSRRTLADVRLPEVASLVDAIIGAQGWPPPANALGTPLNEVALATRMARGTGPTAPVDAFLLLLIIQRRLALWTNADLQALAMLNEGGFERISTHTLLAWLRRAIEKNRPMSEALLELVRAFVIRQHLRVANEKLSQNMHTHRFSDLGGMFSFFDHSDSGLTSISIRFDAIDAALSGLGLLRGSLTTPSHHPSPIGMEILGG